MKCKLLNSNFYFSFADTRNLVMQLQPQHDFQSRDQSPPPSYSPPQYSPSPPPSYASSALHNTVTQTAPDGVHTVTSLAPNEGVFVPRGQLFTGMFKCWPFYCRSSYYNVPVLLVINAYL